MYECGVLAIERTLGGQVMAKNHAASMKSAKASVRMEGYTVTDKMRESCRRVLAGKATTAEVLRQFTLGRNGAKQWDTALIPS